MFEAVSEKFPTEAAIIGRLLCGYAELEFNLLTCISDAFDDFDTAVKAMFRTRGETQRIEVADALARQKFHRVKLGTEFEMAVAAMQHCRRIRNQYSHCHFYAEQKSLSFVDLEEVAIVNTPVTISHNITQRKINAALLAEQESFFGYTTILLIWLGEEAQSKRLSSPAPNGFSKPKEPKRPPLYMP